MTGTPPLHRTRISEDMMGRVISGTHLAGRIRKETVAKVEQLRRQGVRIRLDGVIVGDPEAGSIFARSQCLCGPA